MTLKELVKLAKLMNQEEERRQAAQFAGLGTVAVPAVSAARGLIEHGKPLPSGSKPGRWLAGQAITGAVLGGALPQIRHALERKNLRGARDRRDAAKLVAAASEAGLDVPVVKSAASSKSSKHMKVRKGRRPIRVETLLKKSSIPGQDLRMPIMGGTKFPTKDSLSKSIKRFKSSSSEVGPNPSMSQLSPQGPKIKDQVPTFGKDVMPKLAEVYREDPLVSYLRKEYAK